MANENLKKAKSAKDDEFFTQYSDIQNEVNAYIDFNKDVFRGKTVLLPCDDPEWSNFTKFFAQNFERFGLKKLISTSFAIESKNVDWEWQPTLFETENPLFDKDKTKIKGKIFTLTADENADGKINIDDLKWNYLEGDGDFRSAEVTKLRDEADIVITNPPFSLFREFVDWLIEADKKFLIIGNMNSISCKEIFPLVMNNKMWPGTRFHRRVNGKNMMFLVPDSYGARSTELEVDEHGNKYISVSTAAWYTNMEHGRRHKPIPLMTMADNIKYSKHKEIKDIGYVKYDNYDVLEVPFTDAIPADYDGIMGVPVSFMDKYCPEQFEILGCTQRGCHDLVPDTKKYDDYFEYNKKTNQRTKSSGSKTNENAYLLVTMETKEPSKNYFMNAEGRIVQSAYTRIFIRHKK